MWIQVNKETKKVEAYIEYCSTTPIPKKDCDLITVDELPTNWMYCKYENNRFILDESYEKEMKEKEESNEIRLRRQNECFPFINRGAFWYEMLTNEQKNELKEWYQRWLDAPQTKSIPDRPSWLK